jgi:hypothetical protein
MKTRRISGIAFLTLVLASIFSSCSASYYIDEEVIKYSINGTYKEGDTQISLNSHILATFNVSEDNISITMEMDLFGYVQTELPYSIPYDFFILSVEEIQSKIKNGASLSIEIEDNFLVSYYNFDVASGTIEYEDLRLYCKWEVNTGLLVDMKIEKQNQVYSMMTIKYSSGHDFYQYYSEDRVLSMKVARFFTSINGAITISLVAVGIIILMVLIIRKRKMGVNMISKSRACLRRR